MSFILWQTNGDGHVHQTAVEQPIWLSGHGFGALDSQESQLLERSVLIGLSGSSIQIAVLIVHEAMSELVMRNGVPLSVGLHELCHTDRLDVGGRTFWVAANPIVEEIEFDPIKHGNDVYCCLTKARLSQAEGDRIVICPGKPGAAPCGAIYKADAWEMAMQSGLKCLSCGFDVSELEEWKPPIRKKGTSLDELLQLAANH